MLEPPAAATHDCSRTVFLAGPMIVVDCDAGTLHILVLLILPLPVPFFPVPVPALGFDRSVGLASSPFLPLPLRMFGGSLKLDTPPATALSMSKTHLTSLGTRSVPPQGLSHHSKAPVGSSPSGYAYETNWAAVVTASIHENVSCCPDKNMYVTGRRTGK